MVQMKTGRVCRVTRTGFIVNTTAPGNEGPLASVSGDRKDRVGEGRQVGEPAPREAGPTESLRPLSPVEQRVLKVLSDERQVTVPILRARTGATAEELRTALDALRTLGLVSRLNTVVESYAPRFPGLRVGD